MKNTLVIFDCFGVIFEDVAPPFLKKYLPENQVSEVKEKLFPPADKGEITYDELLSNMAKELSLDRKEMEEEWNSMFVLKKDILPFIKEIKEKADIALLSNAPESVVENLFEKHGLYPLFDKVFVSHKYNLVKPQKEFYLLCVNSFQKKYDKIYMIDDNISNLKCLEEIGITPVLYEGVEKLKEQLK